jgi:methionyl-tRNA formyltransferase
MSLRIVFMGTPDFALPTLTGIVGAGHEVVAAYTQPPRPAGRGMALRPAPVQVAAERLDIPVLTPVSLRDDVEQQKFREHRADIAVVVAYGLILPQAVLDAPRLGAFNLHASLLPRWRGAAPIHRAIMAGDNETGVAVMRMDAGLDTGPVAMTEKTLIGANATAGVLHDILARLGADLMTRAIAAIEHGSLELTPQDEIGVTYAAKIDKAEIRIDWSRPSLEVHNKIRGLSPFPCAWTEVPTNKGTERVKLLGSTLVESTGTPGTVLDTALTIACADGAVRITDLKRSGGKSMPASAFLRGQDVPIGTQLT